MKFSLGISNVQHIKELTFNVDLSLNKLMCIVGKNGVGKTTLIRAIKNFQATDTFTRTASPYIFNDKSSIKYIIDDEQYDFEYNSNLQVIDTKKIISEDIKNNIYVELPIPHGERFKHFQRLNDIDEELRENISLKKYEEPTELIDFLSKVYNSTRFNNLKEVTLKRSKYYFLLKDDGFYIREDYLSSGEFFVINLYKMIQRKCKLIVIDEIDISLDASAQVNLINELREFCIKYQVNIVFTTHSLALMETLLDLELHYMEYNEGVVTIQPASYNYIKSILFGFKGWDKYLLTEDIMLKKYLQDLITKDSGAIFFEYKIIYIGGASQVIDLMVRNSEEQFFSSSDNVISVLDGDKKEEIGESEKVLFIPFESIEKQLFSHYQGGELPAEITFTKQQENGKELYNSIKGSRQRQYMSDQDIFSFVNERKVEEVKEFKERLIRFLSPNQTD